LATTEFLLHPSKNSPPRSYQPRLCQVCQDSTNSQHSARRAQRAAAPSEPTALHQRAGLSPVTARRSQRGAEGGQPIPRHASQTLPATGHGQKTQPTHSSHELVRFSVPALQPNPRTPHHTPGPVPASSGPGDLPAAEPGSSQSRGAHHPQPCSPRAPPKQSRSSTGCPAQPAGGSRARGEARRQTPALTG